MDGRGDDQGGQRAHLFGFLAPGLIDDLIAVEQLIQAFEVLDVGIEMVEKDNVKNNAHHLRQRRVSLLDGFLAAFFVTTTDADGENLLGSQADDRAERLMEAHTTIAEESGATGRNRQFYRLENKRNRTGGANVVDGDLGRNGHQPDAFPYRVSLRSLNEEIAFSGIVVGGGNSQGVEMATLNVVLYLIARKMLSEKTAKRGGIQ